MKNEWNAGIALELGQARTRDGRFVLNLKQRIMDGKKVLTGDVTTIKRWPKKKTLILTERHYWPSLSGWGSNGKDDLEMWNRKDGLAFSSYRGSNKT